MGFKLNEESFIAKAAKTSSEKVEVPTVAVKKDTTWYGADEIGRETILIYGRAKSGKTFAYSSIIKDVIDRGKRVVVINTDGGLAKTFKQFCGEKWKEYAQKMEYYYVTGINDCTNLLRELSATVNNDTWLFIDLISDFWQYAQNVFIDEGSKGDPIKFLLLAYKNPSTFGALESGKWQYCKRIDNLVTQFIFQNMRCNIVATAGCKDLEIAEKISKQKNTELEFEHISFKPAGQGELSHRFSTVIYVGGALKKYLQIAGDRGYPSSTETFYYEKNFWKKLQEIRKSVEETK